MRQNKHLAPKLAVVTAVAMLLAMSASAESRPSRRTHDRSDRRGETRSGRDAGRTESRGGYDRNSRDSRRDESRNDSWRGDRRSTPSRVDSYRSRQPYYAHGPVSRYSRYGSGYRVWIGGAPYPFFVPESYYRRNPFRVGVSIRLGGYYNPGGYYDYYDSQSVSNGELRGTVESVDYRRDSFVVRNEATGSFVTVVMRDRRGDEVRAGDYIEVSGNWNRSGIFEAYDVNMLRDDYRR